MSEWDSNNPEEENENRLTPGQGLFKFMRNEGGWVVLLLGGLSAMLGGGFNWGTMAMMGIGAMMVAAARAAPEPENDSLETARDRNHRERNREQSPSRERQQELEFSIEPTASRSNEQELELALASSDATDNRQSRTAEELSFIAPPPATPNMGRETQELTIGR